MVEELSKIFSSEPIQDIKREIVLELLNSEKNLEEKTELDRPLKWSALESIREYIESLGLKRSSEILLKFQIKSFVYLISKDRKGRAEYIEALKAVGAMSEQEQKQLDNKNRVIGSV